MQTPCDPAAVAEARRLYETTTDSLRAIGRTTGLNPTTIAGYAKKQTWARPPGCSGIPEAFAAAVAAKRAGKPVGRTAVLRRVAQPLEQEMAASGERLADPHLAPGERDQALKTIAERSRLLGQLDALKPRVRAATTRTAAPAKRDDDVPPRDLTALRTALAERLERLCAARRAERGDGDGER